MTRLPSPPPRPTLERLHVKNFRALRNLEFHNLKSLSALLGPNGSGKSTVFDVFAFLAECFTDGLRRAVSSRGDGTLRDLRSRGVSEPISLELTYRERPGSQGNAISYHLEIDEGTAYPGVQGTLDKRASFRDPDAIAGGTWEALLKVLQRAGYYRGLNHLPKLDVARQIAPHMSLGANRSRSFQAFATGLQAIVA